MEPRDPASFTRARDRIYTRLAGAYAWAVPRLPIWKTWLHTALPHLEGPRVLEVALGTGYLLSRYAERFDAVGVDFNRRMLETARAALATSGAARLVRADAARLPFREGSFDTVLCTMALSGMPRALPVLGEFRRVLRPKGRLVLLDIARPRDRNLVGTALALLWRLAGDLVRELGEPLARAGFAFEEREVGGFGSVHLILARPIAR